MADHRELSELERGLLVILGHALANCHEPILSQYLAEGIGWVVERLAWEASDAEATVMQEDIIASYLRGE